MIESNSNSVQPPASNDKFVPTCEICSNKHWPFDPSCIGKKGVKENAKKEAKNAKIARKKAAIDAKNEKKQKKIDAKNEKLQIKADKIARIEAMAKAKQQSQALFSAEVKIQNEIKTRTDAEEKARLEAEKRILAETEARDQIGLQAKEIGLLNQKIQEMEKSLLKEKNALLNTGESTAKIKAEYQEAITKIKIKVDEAIAKEKADSARKLELQRGTILRIESENERTVVNLKNDFEEWMAAFKTKSENAIAFEKENSAKQAQGCEEAISKIKSDSDRSIIDMQSKCDDEIKKVRAEAETARQSLEQKIKSEMEEKATDYEELLAIARNKTHSYVEELKQVKVQMLDADIEAKKAIESKVGAEIKKRTELEAGLELEIDAMAERLAIVEKQAEDETEKRILAESQSQDQARLHAEEIATLKQNIQETENALLKEKNALLEVKEHSVKISADYQETIAKIKTDADRSIVDIQSEYADKLNNVIAEAEIARQSLEQKFKAEMEDKARDHERALASVKNKSHSYAEELKKVKIQILNIEINAKRDAERKVGKEIKAALKLKEDAMAESDATIAQLNLDAAKFNDSITKISSKATELEDKANSYAEELKRVRIQLKAEIKAKKKAESEVRKGIIKRTGIETTLKLKNEKMAERIARVEEKTKVEVEREARAQIEKLLVAEAQEQAKIKLDMEDKVESFAGKIAAIKTESERAIAEAKLPVSEENSLSAQIRQEAKAKARCISFFDYDDLDAKKDRKRSTASEHILPQPHGSLLSVYAQDIMRTEIAWCSKEDSIEDALEQMQQQNTEYMLVGKNGIVEGIVSKSDLKGALSPYLQPQFAKWRRPLDDATLQIRIKWVMSKPVHTVGCETELMTILNEIRQLDVLCFPVIDEKHQVVGILTKAEILDALVTFNAEKSNQQPSLQPFSLSCV